MLQLGKQQQHVGFLVDMVAAFLVLNQALTPVDDDFITVKGAKVQRHFAKPLRFKLGKQLGTHKFLYMSDSPKPLLGRGLLEQLEAKIQFEKGKVELWVGRSAH